MKNEIYQSGGGDEQMTPKGVVEELLPHIEHGKGKTIGCPFDTLESEFVKVLMEAGHTVKHTHISDSNGMGDFLGIIGFEFDLIISNPPYKDKKKYGEHCLRGDEKPFLLLLPLNILSDSMVNQTMVDAGKQLQLLIPRKRARFLNVNTGEIGKSPTFKASYIGWGVLQKDLIIK